MAQSPIAVQVKPLTRLSFRCIGRPWSLSETAATNGTGTPGAAKATIVKARTSPSVAMSTFSNEVPKQPAQALRRSKKRAPHDVHWCATRCGWSPRTR